jgi:hypothetical protein
MADWAAESMEAIVYGNHFTSEHAVYVTVLLWVLKQISVKGALCFWNEILTGGNAKIYVNTAIAMTMIYLNKFCM